MSSRPGDNKTSGNNPPRKPGAGPGPAPNAPRTSYPANNASTTAANKPKPAGAPVDAQKKPANYVPVRTNSAPPEEHPSEGQKPHFQPTKTGSLVTHDNNAAAPVNSYRSALKNDIKESNGTKPKTDNSDVQSSPSLTSQPAPAASAGSNLDQNNNSDSYNNSQSQQDYNNHDNNRPRGGSFDVKNNNRGNNNQTNMGNRRRQDSNQNYNQNSYNQGTNNGNNRPRSQQMQSPQQMPQQTQNQPAMNQQQAQGQQQQMQYGYYVQTPYGYVPYGYDPAQYYQYYQAQAQYYQQYPQQYQAAGMGRGQYQYNYQQQMVYPNYTYGTQVPIQGTVPPQSYQQQQFPRQGEDANNNQHLNQQQQQSSQSQAQYQPPSTTQSYRPEYQPNNQQGNTQQTKSEESASSAPVAPVATTGSSSVPPVASTVTSAAPTTTAPAINPPQPRKLKITTKTGEEVHFQRAEPSSTSNANTAANTSTTTASVAPVEEVAAVPSLPVSVTKSTPAVEEVPAIPEKAEPAPVEEASIPENIPVTVVSKKKDKKLEDLIIPEPKKEEVSVVSNAVSVEETESTLNTDSSKAPLKLAPGGKLGGGKKLNEPVNIRKYTKVDILALKPNEEDFCPLQIFGPIVQIGPDSPASSSAHGRGGYNKHNTPRGGARGGESHGHHDGWTRESLPTPPPQKGAKNKGLKQTTVKKASSDPLDVLSQDVTYILNTIALATYDKFCKKLLELPLKNTAMLDKLVELIFEKAIFEPNFTEMYAQLCLDLKEKSNWSFFTVVKSYDSNEFFWVRDLAFPDDVAGPFFSKQDMLNALNAAEAPAVKNITTTLENVEVLLYNQRLIKAGQNMDGSWFVSFIPFDEENVPSETRGQVLFQTDKEAQKDAVTQISFRGRLANSCEKEFQKSVKDESMFDQVDEELNQLKAKRSSLSEEEYEIQENDILERRGKIKGRMLANIRFVGELYKKKLLNTDTMHECIIELLGTPGEWKDKHDEQDLELLCRLLKTVGEALEQKAKKSKVKTDKTVSHFNAYFERLKVLSKDKSISSRIRFSIEEVIELRENGWVQRRLGDVPTSVTEMNQRAQQEQKGGKAAPTPAPVKGNLTRPGVGEGDYRQQGQTQSPATSNKYSGRPQNQALNAATSAASSSSKNNKPSTSAIPTDEVISKLEFTEANIRRGAHTSLEEYLSGIELAEVKLYLKESSFAHTGYFIQEICSEYLNTSKANIKEACLKLFDDEELANWFVTNRNVVERAIDQLDSFKGIVDISIDINDAPDRLGVVFNKLIKIGALQLDRVLAMADKYKKYNMEQEFVIPEDVDRAFERLLSKLA